MRMPAAFTKASWRHALLALYELGGSATTREVTDMTVEDAFHALRAARRYGAVEGERKGCCRAGTGWRITERGRALVEGRLRCWRDGPRGLKWSATWLESLPRDIRINAGRVAA